MIGFELSEDQKEFQRVAREFAKTKIIPVAAECDQHSKFPHEVFKEAHKLGLVHDPSDAGGPPVRGAH